ncbi:uroporphyrinogen decarboxylase family protein, partial [Myxococcota bacterium]
LGTFMQTHLYGVTARQALYDYEQLFAAHRRFLREYQPDYYASPAFVGSGRVYDILDLKQYKWAGHGLSEQAGYQCVEGEYMMADDYPSLIDDPSGFWLRTLMPRIFGALQPLAGLTPFPFIWEIVGVSGAMIPFGVPAVQAALQALMEAGNEAMQWIQHVAAFDRDARSQGYPSLIGGAAKAPYDILADTLRGTRGIMVDLYRRPGAVIQAMERLLPLYIQQGVGMATAAGNPMVFVPLHKGADGFMSDEQFRTFYWPTLKALLLGLIQEGCVPYLFCEGNYNSRLHYLRELPAGTTFWAFDRSDMGRVKEMLGKTLCIGGNVPSGLLLTGTPDEVRTYCRHLIDVVGRGGGYVMSNGTGMDEGHPENLRAMIEFTREHGVYR